MKWKCGFTILLFTLCFPLFFGCEKTPDAGPVSKVKVTGTVSDENHSPVSGALVVPKPKEDVSGPVPEIARYTDENGRFTWYVPAGSYEFVIEKEGYKPRRLPVQSKDAGKPVHLNVILEKE